MKVFFLQQAKLNNGISIKDLCNEMLELVHYYKLIYI